MALVNKPDESIFASSAKQGEVDNFPDLLRGWGITFDQTQGIPPMEWFNFLFKRLDEKHTYLMQRGLPEWSATQDYTKGSCVQFDGVSYRALKDSKNNSPNESDSQYWVRWGFALSEIAQATLQQPGIVQLSSSTSSESESEAATSKAVKIAHELAESKQSPAATLAGYGIGNFKIEPFVGNVNTLQTDGIYAITQASRSQNLPVAGNGCHIQVIAGGDGRWCRQIAYIAYSTDMYERHQTSYQTDSWSAWVKLNDIEPVRQLVAQKANLADFSYQKIGNFEIRKYPDGTMIQTYIIEQYDLTNWKEKSFNWAQAFMYTPLVLTKITTSYDGVHDCGINVLTKSNNRTCYYWEYEHGAANQSNVRIQFYAIGRWK